MQRFVILPLASVVILAGCATLEQASSGQVGCPSDEIQISDHKRGWSSTTWTATCHDKRFFCSAVSGGESVQISCKESASGGEAVAAATPRQADGCQYDTQCKGDRVCMKGACVAPIAPPAAAPPWPAEQESTPAAPAQ